jgi:hypothetical protein
VVVVVVVVVASGIRCALRLRPVGVVVRRGVVVPLALRMLVLVAVLELAVAVDVDVTHDGHALRVRVSVVVWSSRQLVAQHRSARPGARQPGQRASVRDAPLGGVGLCGWRTVPLQTIRSRPVQAMALQPFEFSGPAPGASVRQLLLRGE